jgi:hypothetical protein
MNMPAASEGTALMAGAWAGLLGLVYLSVVPRLVDPSHKQFLFLCIAALTLIPVFPFVFGFAGNERGGNSLKERLTSGYRANLARLKRMFIWLFGVAAIGMPGNLLIKFFAGAA